MTAGAAARGAAARRAVVAGAGDPRADRAAGDDLVRRRPARARAVRRGRAARRVRGRAVRPVRRALAAVLHDRGRPGAARGRSPARLTARGLPTHSGRAADHQRLPAGADADRDGAARAGRHGAGGGAVLPRGVAGVPARRRDGRARSRATTTASTRRRRRRWPSATARACSTRSRRSRTRPGERCHSIAARRSSRSRAVPDSGCWRTTRMASCATAARACRRWRRSTTACCRSRRCRRSRHPGCGSAGSGRPRRCAAR